MGPKNNCGSLENPPYYLTAYGLAVKHGYEGTEAEWLASLKGEKGDPAPYVRKTVYEEADPVVSNDKKITSETARMISGLTWGDLTAKYDFLLFLFRTGEGSDQKAMLTVPAAALGYAYAQVIGDDAGTVGTVTITYRTDGIAGPRLTIVTALDALYLEAVYGLTNRTESAGAAVPPAEV